ncbi:caspase family protein [Bradyrhizobium sp. AUGA SZCCT0222]|uniref:caspase family protein n=1 Tax=Bradyrhizobium sp. AUGA SZCCT0222 TaxID=2807668 RepID=UPI001BA48019|nr:caspase family protein [Bradyrhizobium sp. AUGA SZCCT0222]MBR1268775.1 caspase family protein [Bradyrhizobium sp. AUGA SZCCT0222]
MPGFKSLALCAGLLGSLLSLAHTSTAFAEAVNADISDGVRSLPAEQRVALVIGNANYQTAPRLANPSNDARSVAQLLNTAGFEVTAATDLTRSDMIKAVEDFVDRVSNRGPNAVAMIYYAGHGVQLEGENYLLPIDARISKLSDLDSNSLRLVDLMGTLETISSRMRIVVLDACRNNPFPDVDDSGRGLAMVDAPAGSIVGYSTAPGMVAHDGDGNHSPYTSAFLNIARQPNLPIEQLFKRVRLEVNNATGGRQTPWESSSLTNDFYFFGDTAVAATRAPDRGPVVQMASNLPSRSVRQAYDYVLSEGSPEHYEEFIQLYPSDPLSDRVRVLLGNWRQSYAWHKAVLTNTSGGYRSFRDRFPDSPYARTALRLQAQPRNVPLMHFNRLSKHSGHHGHGFSHGHRAPSLASSPKGMNASASMNGHRTGRFTNTSSGMNAHAHANHMHGKSRFHDRGPRRMGGGMHGHSHSHSSHRFAANHSRSSFAHSRHSFGGGRSFSGGGSFGGGRSFGGGGFRR